MNRWVSCIAVLVVCCASTSASAEERSNVPPPSGVKVISGDVGYSDPNAATSNSQVDTLNALEDWGAKLQTIVASSGEGKVADLDQNAVSYLSVLYLFCSAKRGPCPFILETLLDSDIALARADNEAKCPLMKRFFKSYVSQSLDERGKFLFPLTRGLEMAKFNANERPRFVECKETVSAIIADKELLSQRFGEKGSAVGSVAEFRALLSEIKDQKADIFVATGIRAP